MALIRSILKGLVLLSISISTATAQRHTSILRDGWKFSRGEMLYSIAPSQANYNDK